MTIKYKDFSLMDRFWSRVDVRDVAACWSWLAGRATAGYGVVWTGRCVELAHRLAYQLTVGPIPDGLVIDHLCSNKVCCNPSHMEPVSRGENRARAPLAGVAELHAAQDRCINGHEFTRISDRGERLPGRARLNRVCRECANSASRSYRARKARA